jgi:hypothetical protein
VGEGEVKKGSQADPWIREQGKWGMQREGNDGKGNLPKKTAVVVVEWTRLLRFCHGFWAFTWSKCEMIFADASSDLNECLF